MNKNESLKRITSTLSGVPQSAPRQKTPAVIVYIFVAILLLACSVTAYFMLARAWLGL